MTRDEIQAVYDAGPGKQGQHPFDQAQVALLFSGGQFALQGLA